MAREDRKGADLRRNPEQDQPPRTGKERRNGDSGPRHEGGWYAGERGNEFGGEGRFRTEGGQGSHFGGEPEAAGDGGSSSNRNTNAWHGDRRRKFVEKFDRWRSERAARAAHRGPDSASADSAPRATGRSAKK